MKYLLSLILLSALTTTASAQITITSDEYVAAFANTSTQQNFETSDTTGLRAIETSTGANQNWNFTGYTWAPSTSSTTGELIPASSAPLSTDPDFSAATHAVRSPNGNQTDYLFLKLNSDGVWLVGMVQDSAGVASKVAAYNPPLQQMKFPIAYGSHWTSTSLISAPDLPPGATFSMTYDNTVDGYGMIVLPGNKTADALKITSLQTTTIAAPPFFSSSSHEYQYTFVTKTGLNATITADSALRPTAATYSITDLSAVNEIAKSANVLSVSLDPTSGSTKLYYTMDQDGPANLALIDVNGRVISTLQNGFVSAGTNEIRIDPKSVCTGMYLIRLMTTQGTATTKVMLAR